MRYERAFGTSLPGREGCRLFDAFAHYLSYGASDQQTARALTDQYDGLLVPGTVAAFQTAGTKGFVLTLSARQEGPSTRYVIDPRFPLFQQGLSKPKKSHQSLAELLGDPSLVDSSNPSAEDFDDDRVEAIAESWVQFNTGYTELTAKQFDKYAQRLDEVVVPIDATLPEAILAPYFMADGTSDEFWDVSSRLWQATQSAAVGTGLPVYRVIAAKEPHVLVDLLDAEPSGRVALWVDAIDEFQVDGVGMQRLTAYARAVRHGSAAGKQMFALYGGYFAVMLGSLGLSGASHGIGYGEQRAYIELPNSGPPPARYYLPIAHKYVSQDLAEYFESACPGHRGLCLPRVRWEFAWGSQLSVAHASFGVCARCRDPCFPGEDAFRPLR